MIEKEKRNSVLQLSGDRIVLPGGQRTFAGQNNRVIEEHPSKSVALEVAYSEYCRRLEQQKPHVESFVREFPGIESSLRRQIEVHHALISHLQHNSHQLQIQWPDVGEKFLEFEIISQIGIGGLSRVFLCKQPSMGNRLVVLKVSFNCELEAHILGRIAHPNIVPIFSVHNDYLTDLSAICMPFLGCATMVDVIDKGFTNGALPVTGKAFFDAIALQYYELDSDADSDSPPRTLTNARYEDTIVRLMANIAEALGHAHEQGVMHGDLKPSNILLTGSCRPMLLDFNLSSDSVVQSSISGGTLPYMAPEQIEVMVLGKSFDRITVQSDVFSFGVVLYELLTGTRPFDCADHDPNSTALGEHLLGEIGRGAKSIREINPRIDRALDCFVLSCIDTEPKNRPSSMRHVRDALLDVVSFRHRIVRCFASHKKLTYTGILLIAVCVVTLFFYLGSLAPYPQRQYLQAKQFYLAGNYNAASTALIKALDSQPKFAEALYLRGRVRLHQKEYQDALTDFGQVLDIRRDARVMACSGYSLHLLSEIRRAEYWYTQALENGYESSELLNNLGVICTTTGNNARAETYLNRAIEIKPHAPILRFNRALVELQRAQSDSNYHPKQGITDINIFLESHPDSAEAHWLGARLFGYSARLDKTLANKALKHLGIAGNLGWLSNREELRRNPAFKAFVDQLDALTHPLADEASQQPHKPLDRLLDPVSESEFPRAIKLDVQ